MTTDNNSKSSPSADESNNNDGDSSHNEKGSRQQRLAKAQAEIDRILNNPVDPPFDFESVMKKVTSISPPLIKEGSAEFQLEEQVSEIEEQLYDAVKAQDFDTAAKKSAEISQIHVDDCGLVLQANSAFYRAFSDKDVGEMERLWLKDRSCICIHPSFKPLTGVRDIMSTWKRMFESSVGSFQRTWIDPCDIHLTVKGTTAVVTCVEDVYARRFVRGRRRKSELVNKLTATNIFRKVGGRWYITYHHSSWHANSEAAKRALKTGNKSTKTKSSSPRKIISSDPFGDNLLNLRSLRKDTDDDNDESDEKNDDPTELESILGVENVGPVLGDDSESKEQGNAGGSRIISSNLDFLKDLGGLDGMLGMGNSDGTGLPPGSIIRISKVNGDMDEGDDDEDDYDEDEDEDDFDDDEDTSNKGELSILELLAKKKKEKKQKMLDKQRAKAVRPRCIDALRKLSKDGRISPKQKRILLTEIISCSARGEESLVEHAYKLLCDDSTDEEAAEEEFVEQCQVFAQSLFEIS
jgi:ketosteroid isomerase-like protein